MNNEVMFEAVLKEIVSRIVSKTISKTEIREKVQNELETKDIWESDNFLITDCYYALKHIDEEEISIYEWKYFLECFKGHRKYDLKEKIKFISYKENKNSNKN